MIDKEVLKENEKKILHTVLTGGVCAKGSRGNLTFELPCMAENHGPRLLRLIIAFFSLSFGCRSR